MQFKLIIALILALGAAGGGWYITHVIGENARLEVAVDEAVRANAAANLALAEAEKIRKEQDALILQRERQRQAQAAQLGQLKRELRNAKNQITDAERECMESLVPVHVLDLLRRQAQGGDRAPSEEGVPDTSAVRTAPAAPHAG